MRNCQKWQQLGFFRSGDSKGMIIQFMAGKYMIELSSYPLHFTFRVIKGQANRRWLGGEAP